MKISKYIIGITIVGALSLGGIILGSANEKFTTVDGKEIGQAYNDLVNQEGIEHLILTESDGTTLDIYRDRNNGKERVDYYDENNMLIERNITTDYGTSFMTLAQNKNKNNEWEFELIKTLPPQNAVSENKELMKKSMIDGYFIEELKNEISRSWKKYGLDTKNNLVKYSDSTNNIYIDPSTGLIEKREIMLEGKVVKTFDVEVLSNDNGKSIEIFQMDAPLIKENSIGGNKNIRTINKELKIEIEDNSGVEYDPSNGKG